MRTITDLGRSRLGKVVSASLLVLSMLGVMLTTSDVALGSPRTSGPPSNKPAAQAASARIFASVSFPTGTKRSSSVPRGAGRYLARPAERPASWDFVSEHGFYVVHGMKPAAILSWFKAHRPKGSRLAGSGWLSSGGTTEMWFLDFGWKAVHDVLASQDVLIGVVQLTSGGVALRVDSQVVYRPERRPIDEIPRGFRKVTVLVATPTLTGGPGKNLEPPIVTTNRAKISKVRSAVNDLQVLVPMPFPYPCPPGPNLDVFVEFASSTSAGAKPLATVTAYPYGCAFVSIKQHGHVGKQTLVDGGSLASALAKDLGLRLPKIPMTS